MNQQALPSPPSGRARFAAALLVIALAGGCTAPQEPKRLYVWAGDADGRESDFLATIDADPQSSEYGRIIATTPVGETGTVPHHTDYEFPADGVFMANGWAGARTFVFDARGGDAPIKTAAFSDVGEYSYPHSFLRLPGGRIIATFQGRGGAYGAPGGIAELTAAGEFVHGVSASAPGVDDGLAWPYSLAYAAHENRIVVTMSEMGLSPAQTTFAETKAVQIYNAETLALESRVELPAADGRELWPAEPRVAADGTVYVNTFMCGLFRIDNVGRSDARAAHVYSFPLKTPDDVCAVPVIVGNFWVQTVGAINGLIALDISDPQKPVEVSRLLVDHDFHMPHWLAADADGRLVMTGMRGAFVLIGAIDPDTGALSLDERFRDAGAEKPGVILGAAPFPHGDSGEAIAHGALFGR